MIIWPLDNSASQVIANRRSEFWSFMLFTPPTRAVMVCKSLPSLPVGRLQFSGPAPQSGPGPLYDCTRGPGAWYTAFTVVGDLGLRV